MSKSVLLVIGNFGLIVIVFSITISCVALDAASIVLEGTFTVLETIDERHDSEEQIWVFIENKTNEALVLFAEDYFKGFELARIPKGKENKIKVTRGRTAYISGGNTQKKIWSVNFQ